jgi:hypothetical protein
MEKTGEATVIEKTVTQGFFSNKGFEHPLAGLAYQIVKFRGKEYLLTGMLDGLDGMAVCLMVKPFDSGSRLKLYTDTPTPEGKTKEAVRENARQTINLSLKRFSRGW